MFGHSIFVVCDGPSGSGKDSLLKALAMELARLDHNCFVLSEEDLLAKKAGIASGGTGDILMSTKLVEHRALIYSKHLLPKLNGSVCILANRGLPATLAYQTARNELTMDKVWAMHLNANVIAPDLVILTKCKPETAVSREEKDRQNRDNSSRVQRESGKGLSGKVTNEPGADLATALKRRKLVHEQFEKAANFLVEKGITVLVLDTETLTVAVEVKKCLKAIFKMWD
jgi:thymidylate kinase